MDVNEVYDSKMLLCVSSNMRCLTWDQHNGGQWLIPTRKAANAKTASGLDATTPYVVF